MEVIIFDSPDQVADLAASAFLAVLSAKPTAVLGLATGSSPLGLYARLRAAYEDGEVSLAAARAFTLDEYVGLSPDDPQSYRQTILREFAATDLRPDSIASPRGWEPDLPAECARYEADIAAAGGVDIQVLGLGTDGHIAFNEPGSSLGSRTRIKTLTAQTRRDNARFWDGDLERVPTHCLTQGIATIMQARHVIVLATGSAKSTAVAGMVEGPVSASVPASALQWHPHVSVLLDEAAASRLERREYYRETFASKPPWQGL